MAGILFKQGPRDWLCQTAGAAALSAAGIDTQCTDLEFILFQQGPRDWLRQTAGAAAPSGGR